jgi:hypothetical protein
VEVFGILQVPRHLLIITRELRGFFRMVGPNGLEPSTSSVSRKRSNQTELRAYMNRFPWRHLLPASSLARTPPHWLRVTPALNVPLSASERQSGVVLGVTQVAR